MSSNETAPRPLARNEGPKVGGGTPQTTVPADDVAQQLRRRRRASLRLPPMPCGHRDPLDHGRGAA